MGILISFFLFFFISPQVFQHTIITERRKFSQAISWRTLKKSQTFIVLLTNQLASGRKGPLRNCMTFPNGVWCIGGKDGQMWKTSCPSLKNCEQVPGSFPLLVTLCVWWTSKNTTLFWNPACLGLTLWKFMSDVCVCIFVKWLVL